MQRDLDAVTRRLVDLYDDCLLGLDAELGRFLGGLRASGVLDETWVVITSDHGEEFGEHGIFGHGASLYNQVTHVPLILIPPMGARGSDDDPYASMRGRRIDVPVSQRDLPATLASLLLPGTDNPFPGRSLARHWGSDGPGPPTRSWPRWRSNTSRATRCRWISTATWIPWLLTAICSSSPPGIQPELYDLMRGSAEPAEPGRAAGAT